MNEGRPDEATSTDELPETEPTADPVIDLTDVGGLAPSTDTEAPLPTIEPAADPWRTDHITSEPAESTEQPVPGSEGDLSGIGEPDAGSAVAEQVDDEPRPAWDDAFDSSTHVVEDERPVDDEFDEYRLGENEPGPPVMVLGEADQVLDLRNVLTTAGGYRFRYQPGRRPRLILVVSLVLVLAAVGVVWFLAGPADEVDPATVGVTVPTTAAVVEPSTTVATTAPPATTAPTTTTTTLAARPFIEPIGDGLAPAQLDLQSVGLGSLRLGDDAGEVLGILTASFGQPDRDSGSFVSQGEYGTCPVDQIRAVQWGPLVVIASLGGDGPATFIGYRLDGTLADAGDPILELKTVSGLRVGDSLETLDRTYSNRYTISLTEDRPGGPGFEILSGSRPLLTGALSSLDENATVLGIFSPGICEAEGG